MNGIMKNLFWIIQAIAPTGFVVFSSLTLFMILSDPYLDSFFSRKTSIEGFIGLTALFTFFLFNKLFYGSKDIANNESND